MGSTTYQLVQPNPKESRGSGSITWDSVLDTSQLCLHRNGPGLIRTGKRVSQNVSKHKKMNNKKSSEVFFCLKAPKKTNKINIYWTTNTNHFILQPDLTSAFFSFARDFQGREIFQKVTNFMWNVSRYEQKRLFSLQRKISWKKFAAEICPFSGWSWLIHPAMRCASSVHLVTQEILSIGKPCTTPVIFWWPLKWSGHTTGFLASNSGTDVLLGGRRLQWSWHALDLSELA